MKRYGALAVFVFTVLGSAALGYAEIAWQDNLQDGMAEAKRAQKPLMVDFYTDWCGWCKKLDAETYVDQGVVDRAAQFICVKVDADKDRESVQKYKVHGYPTVLFLNYNGEVDDTIVGFGDAQRFSAVMDGVLDKTLKPSAEPAPVVRSAPDPEDRPTARSGFRLGGITTGGKVPVAIINDTLVRVGEVINGAKVIEIQSDSVTLLIGDKRSVLKI